MMATYPTGPGAKRGAIGTSAEAAAAVGKDAATLRAACLAVLGAEDMTADEVAARLGESVLSIRPRCSELVKLRKVRDSGRRRENVSGRAAAVLTTRAVGAPQQQEMNL